MSANTSADTSTPGAAATPSPPSPSRGAPAHVPLRSGLLLGVAVLALAGVSAVVFAPTLADLRAHLVGTVPTAGEAPSRAPPRPGAAPRQPPAPHDEAAPLPATAAAAATGAGGPLPPAASEDPGDPWAELRALMEEARSPVPRAEVRGMADERAERQRLASAQRDLGLLVRQSLETQVALRREIARQDAEHRAALEGVQSRLDTLNMRVAFAADARAAAAAPAPAATAAAPPQQQPPAAAVVPVAGAAAPRPRLPYETPGHVPPRSLRSPAAGWQVSEASPDMALLVAAKPAPGQPASMVVRAGTEVPGLGRVQRIERRGAGWEVHTSNGIVTQ